MSVKQYEPRYFHRASTRDVFEVLELTVIRGGTGWFVGAFVKKSGAKGNWRKAFYGFRDTAAQAEHWFLQFYGSEINRAEYAALCEEYEGRDA